MKKRALLNVNFSDEENKLIVAALKKVDPEIKITTSSLGELAPSKNNLSNINLVLVKLYDENKQNKALLEQVKKQFFHFPIILISSNGLSAEELKPYDLKNVIDVRPLSPLFLVAKSVAREIKSQSNKYSLHQLDSQFKNESYRFESFLKHTEDGVALIHDGQYWSANDAYKRIFDIPESDDLTCSPVLEFGSPTSCPIDGNLAKKNLNTSLEALPDETILSVLIQTRNGDSFVTTLYKTHCFVKDQLCTQILVHNPDAWSNIEKGFTDLRTFDHNTGLYNKRFANEYISNTLDATSPHGSLAIILIDDFRHMRTQYGMQYTDDVTRSVANFIKESSANNDILAHYGDAVFTLFSDELGRSDFLMNCQQILTNVSNALFGDDSQYMQLTLSIGVSFISPTVTSVKQLTSHADEACDTANTNGGNQIHVYDSISTPLTVIIDEKKNTRLIQSALEHNRLHPLYQPIVDLSQKATENYAVLLRILDEKNKHIPPDHFILTAEKTGLISLLDEWVLKSTIEQVREASRQGLKRRFFVSISSNTYRNASFLETLASDLKFYNIDASLLVFQVNYSDVKTEPALLKKFIAIVKNKCGCQLAFDQIGFNQVTEKIIQEYDVDYLKIDGSFSQNLLQNKESQEIIKNIIQLARKNNVKTIAKSVENANTLALLWNLGIDAVQGYFLQKPSDLMRFDFDLNN